VSFANSIEFRHSRSCCYDVARKVRRNAGREVYKPLSRSVLIKDAVACHGFGYSNYLLNMFKGLMANLQSSLPLNRLFLDIRRNLHAAEALLLRAGSGQHGEHLCFFHLSISGLSRLSSRPS
jgi:hypothetical protein